MSTIITIFLTVVSMLIAWGAYKLFWSSELPMNDKYEAEKRTHIELKKNIVKLKKKAEEIKNDKTIYTTESLINDIKHLL